MPDQRVNVTIAIPEASRFAAVLDAAAALGLHVTATFPRLGIAAGTLPRAAMADLEALEGIGGVDVERTFRADGEG